MYGDTEELKNEQGIRYYANAVYPDIPISELDIYLVPTIGDRLDLLADKYYKDVRLYKIIAIANSLPCDSLYPPAGQILRIPNDIDAIKRKFTELNNVR